MAYTLMPGDTVPNFNPLVSTDRSSYNLDSLPSRQFDVVFFTCNHCPYVTGSDELTRELVDSFKEQVNFVAINSNSKNTYGEDSFENMVLRMEANKFPWLYLHDETQETAKLFGALKTPHFFLMNSERKLLYTGRATDNPLDIEKRKTNDLEKTLEEALAGKEISNPVTNPIGCNIKWDGKPAHWMPAEACDLI